MPLVCLVAEVVMPSPLAEYDPELETLEGEQSAWPGESGSEVLSETDELEMAAELLAVTNEQELDQFLGDLIRKVGRTVGQAVRSPIGRAVGRRPQGCGSERAAGRRRRAWHVRRWSARDHDRQRARIHGGTGLGLGARGLEP